MRTTDDDVALEPDVDRTHPDFVRRFDRVAGYEWRDRDGRRHCSDGPAVVFDNGDSEWYCHGVMHRDDGPAFCRDGAQVWMRHGRLHRRDGPAAIGGRLDPFWVEGVRFSTEEFEAFTALDPAAATVAEALLAEVERDGDGVAAVPGAEILAAATSLCANR